MQTIKNLLIKFFKYEFILVLFIFFGPLKSFSSNDQKSCLSYLSFQNSLNKNSLAYSLLTYFQITDSTNLKDNDYKIMLEELNALIIQTPTDPELLNVYWHISKMINPKTLEIRNRRLELLERLEFVLSSSELVISKEEILYRYFIAYTDLKDYRKAFSIIFRLSEESPKDLTYIISRIKTNISLKEYRRAISFAEAKLLEFPNNISLLQLAAEANFNYANSIHANSAININNKIAAFASAEKYLELLFDLGPSINKYYVFYVRALLGQRNMDKFTKLGLILEPPDKSLPYGFDEKTVMYYRVLLYLGSRELDKALLIIDERAKKYGETQSTRRLRYFYENILESTLNISGPKTTYDDFDLDYVPDLN